tara:strand:+ start:222 stop:632 length:411 start_codon:yes stop_codon:yes gene_type:complete
MNNMGRKLRVKKQKGKANKYFIGDKEVSEKEYVKTYTDAANEGKKVNPDFKPRSVKELTSPATLKKGSGFKLRSGNKPSIAKMAGVKQTQGKIDFTKEREMVKKEKEKIKQMEKKKKKLTIKAKNVFPGTKKGILD